MKLYSKLQNLKIVITLLYKKINFYYKQNFKF